MKNKMPYYQNNQFSKAQYYLTLFFYFCFKIKKILKFKLTKNKLYFVNKKFKLLKA